jgi:4'-phosphopantetheinyl transferase
MTVQSDSRDEHCRMNIADAAFHIETQTPLPDDEVHLWRVDLAVVAQPEQRWQQILSADERTRAARFHFPKDRKYFTATRALLRIILGSYVGCNPTELSFRYSVKEKPSLNRNLDRTLNRTSDRVPHPASSHSESQVEFNVSHSGDVALLAFSRGRTLGVDVEQLREIFDQAAIARRFFSEQEQTQLAELPPSEQHLGFFRCWTRKEAYIKAQGAGLSLPLDRFDVSLKTGERNALLSTRPDETEAAQWSLQEVPAGEGYVGALCVRGHGWRLKL